MAVKSLHPVVQRLAEVREVKGVPAEEVAKTKAKVDQQIAAASGLSKEAEEEALDREIRIKSKHVDLTDLEQGKQPSRLVAEWSAKGGFWKLAALIIDIIRKFV